MCVGYISVTVTLLSMIVASPINFLPRTKSIIDFIRSIKVRRIHFQCFIVTISSTHSCNGSGINCGSCLAAIITQVIERSSSEQLFSAPKQLTRRVVNFSCISKHSLRIFCLMSSGRQSFGAGNLD